jgi:hypothetical protein
MNEPQPANTLSSGSFALPREAYRLALEFHKSLVPLARGRELYALRDQLLRAAESVVQASDPPPQSAALPAPEGQMRGAANAAMPARIASEAATKQMPRKHPVRDIKGRASRPPIALGSLLESVAALDCLRSRAALAPQSYQDSRALAIRLYQILSRLTGPPR